MLNFSRTEKCAEFNQILTKFFGTAQLWQIETNELQTVCFIMLYNIQSAIVI